MYKINFWNELKVSLLTASLLLILVSGIYPLIVWGLSKTIFPSQAQGSLIHNDRGQAIGSALLAQGFTSTKYFHPRYSLAGGGYDATSSGGSNLGQTSQILMDTLKARASRYREENGLQGNTEIPADAVTASASGLDPEISPDNAFLQVYHVAKARNLDIIKLQALVNIHIRGRDLGFLGEPGVNVLKLNLALDNLK